ncbi:MAG: DivIVA domain-containing protein [Candidatus Marinimicrobia bacterium]|nr:DivIVA domain-containing protein [Candidatus Neomarinimicrobiota bacterium]MCF7904423.1 DivIVA domain-containing protein [Candidatus Neomarinimicrobiota bacterium]
MARLTPQEIREHEFKQSALGYSKEQVIDFLDGVAEELETLTREMNQIHQENKEARLALQTYANVEESLKETLTQAKATAQNTLQTAQAEADTVLRKAQVEKDALLFSVKEDLATLQAQIRELKARRDEMLTRLKSVLRSNLEVLGDSFPADEPGVAPQEANPSITDERIVDFSEADLSVEDLPSDPDPVPDPETESQPEIEDVFNIPEDPEKQ